MKKFAKTWLLAGWAVLLNVAPVIAQGSPWELDLPFETAIIHYDISGSQKGTETLYIRDSGNERVKVTRSKGKMLFVTVNTNTMEITTRDDVINIDMDKETGTRMTNPQKFMREEMARLAPKDREIAMRNLETIGMNMAVQMGGEVKQKAGEQLGFSCDIVTVMGTTSCQMSGTPIMLKMESNLMGVKMNTVAKKIDKNAAIPAGIFQVPEGIKVTYSKEADEMSRAMMASMIESMKDPDAARKFEEGVARAKLQMEEDQRQQQAVYEQEYGNDADSDPGEDTGEEDADLDEKKINEVMQKGVKSLKGFFK